MKKISLFALGSFILAPFISGAQNIPASVILQKHRPASGTSFMQHNPMAAFAKASSAAQQKTTAVNSRLIAAWEGDATLGTGGYYPSVDSQIFTYDPGRGGEPVQDNFGSNYGTFNTDNIPYKIDDNYDPNTGILVERFTRTLDAQGRTAQMLQQDWDGSNLAPTNRTVYAYTGSSLITATDQGWNIATSAWVNNQQDSSFYNGVGQCTAIYIRSWNDTTKVWTNSYRQLFTYDAAGNTTAINTNTWANGIWIYPGQELYSYNAANQLLTYSQYYRDSAAMAFKLEYDDTYHYNGSGQLSYLITRDSTGFRTSGKYHVSDSLVNTALNSAGYPLTTINYVMQGGTWARYRKWEESYNTYNQVTSEYITHWDGSAFVIGNLDYAFRYYYEAYVPAGVARLTAADLRLSVYPNPSSGLIHVSLNGPESAYTATILDAAGRMVQQWQTTSGKANGEGLDVSCLPVGNYVLSLRNACSQSSAAFTVLNH